jgi:hypothetical protein
MDARDFYSQVQNDARLEWGGSKIADAPSDDKVFVSCPSRRLYFSLDIPTIKQHSWDVLRSVLVGYRDAIIMTQVTRIVGYYSQINNWNRSKKAELADRHKGSYGLFEDTEGSAPKVPAPTPEPVMVAEQPVAAE